MRYGQPFKLKEFHFISSILLDCDTEDEVEKIGIERSWREIERADVVLPLVDSRIGVTDSDRGYSCLFYQNDCKAYYRL